MSADVGAGARAPRPARRNLGHEGGAPQLTMRPNRGGGRRRKVWKAIADGFTEDELAAAKKGGTQSPEVIRTQDASLARRLSGYLGIDRTMVYDKDSRRRSRP
jgi:zinc protease